MIGNSFYVGFAAFIQLTVGFNFGLIYLYKNNRSIFKSVQNVIFDGFRRNAVTKWVLCYPQYVISQISPRTHREMFCKYKARVVNHKNAILAAYNYERTCDYIAATGIVSAFYGLEWLVLVPWTYSHMLGAEYVYGTSTLVAIVCTVFMLMHALCNRHITRGMLFLLAIIAYAVVNFIAFVVWSDAWKMDYVCDFDNIFLLSLLVAVSPIVYFVFHLLIMFIYRMTLLIYIVFETLSLQMLLKCCKAK